MRLPFAPPVAPMLSSAADALPAGEGWLFEPKWDGFRTLVFRDGGEILLQSRDEKPMNRYFPELVAPLGAALPERCVVDGEIVIVGDGGLDFEALLLRIHPAASRVKLLAEQAPASFVAWDLLALGDEDLRPVPLAARRERLEWMLAGAPPPVHLSPATRDRALAEDWFRRFEGAGLDGVMAKRLDAPYRAGERTMIKVKHRRTADCVVAGFRWHAKGPGTMVGSLLLGLYDDDHTLHHVGVAAAQSRQGWPSSASARSPTTTCRGRASGTPPSSCAGVPTRGRTSAATPSSTSRRPTSSRASSVPVIREAPSDIPPGPTNVTGIVKCGLPACSPAAYE